MSDLSDFFPGGGGEGGGGGLTWSLRDADFTAEDGNGYAVDTATNGEVTVTLPSSPTLNQQIGLKDHFNNFHDKNLRIDPGAENIEGMAGVMVVNTRGWGGELMYSESSRGWLLTYNTPMATVANKPFMHLQDRLPSGGTRSYANTPYTRELNSILHNDIPGAALNGNEVDLPAGEYYFEGYAVVAPGSNNSNPDWCRIFLRKTDDTTLATGGYGDARVSSGTSYVPMTIPISGRIVLSAPTTIKLVTHSKNGRTVYAAGIAGEDEVHADLRIWKLDTEIKKITVDDPQKYLKKPLMHVQDQKPQNTNPQSAAIGDNIRNLNTILTGEIAGASLSNNQITLPAGEYYIEAWAAMNHQNALSSYNKGQLCIDVDGVRTIAGSTHYSHYRSSPHSCKVGGRITLAQPAVITLNHRMQDADANTTTFGHPGNVGVEVYADIKIWQEDAVVEDSVITVPNPEKYLKRAMMQLNWELPEGTNPDGNPNTSIRQIRLNTLKVNEIAGASADTANFTFTLPPGEYEVDLTYMEQGDNSDNRTSAVIQHVSDNTPVLWQNVQKGANADQFSLTGRFTLAVETELKCTHYGTKYRGTASWENSGFTLGNEIYASLKIYALEQAVQAPTAAVFQPRNQPVAGAYVTGGIYGGELVYVNATSFSVNPVSCMDDTLTEALALPLASPALGPITIAGIAADTVYNVFIVKVGAAFEIRTDTDVDGANLGVDVTHKRWLGFVGTDGASAIRLFVQNGDLVSFGISSQNTLASTNNDANYQQIDHTSRIPVPRIAEISYGSNRHTGAASLDYPKCSLDGVNTEANICTINAIEADTSGLAWGLVNSHIQGMMPFTPNRYFSIWANFNYLLIQAVKLKR